MTDYVTCKIGSHEFEYLIKQLGYSTFMIDVTDEPIAQNFVNNVDVHYFINCITKQSDLSLDCREGNIEKDSNLRIWVHRYSNKLELSLLKFKYLGTIKNKNTIKERILPDLVEYNIGI